MKTKTSLIPLVAGLALTLVLLWLLVLSQVKGLGGSAAPSHAQGPDGFDTYYVAPGGNCGGATPCYASVQDAVDGVDDPSDVVKVATGVYTGVGSGRASRR